MCQFSNFRDLVQRSRPQGFVKRRSGASVKIRTLYHPTSRAWPRRPHAMLWIVDRNFRHTWRSLLLEPISKSPEEDNEAGELNKAQEILGVVLPADEDSALPLHPGEEALNEPAAHIAG